MAALDTLTEQDAAQLNRGVLRQLADNGLVAELAPYMKKRPFARIGLSDPSRVSVLPYILPEDEPYPRSTVRELRGLLGQYQPAPLVDFRDKKTTDNLLKAYSLPDLVDRIVLWRSNARRKPRENEIQTLLHEAEHRGQQMIRDTRGRQTFDLLNNIREQAYGDEVSARITDAMHGPDAQERKTSRAKLSRYYLDPESEFLISRPVDKETFEFKTGGKFGPYLTLDQLMEAVKYNKRKTEALDYLKKRGR